MDLHKEEELTPQQIIYLDNLFWKHNEEINSRLKEEIYILNKYKGYLAGAYNEVRKHINTSMQFIQEIYDKQDSIVLHMNALDKMFQRIEHIILENHEVEIRKGHKNPILDKPIEYLELKTRAENCLKGAGIKTIGELINCTKIMLTKISNLGRWSLVDIQDQLARHHLKLKE